MSDKNLVFLTEGPEGWDTPIADLVAACGDVGQKAVLIDLLKSDSSALLGKAAGEGIAAFVSMEGVGARITANNRSIFEVLQAPLLTFLPDHPCFYAPLLTTPQKLVVPMFFSQDHVTAARGIFGNVPLAPVIEPWGPRTLELEGEPVPAIFVDASTFEVAKALEGQHPRVRELVASIVHECAETMDVYAAYTRALEARWIPVAGIAATQRARLCQWSAASIHVARVRALLNAGTTKVACGTGWPSAVEPRLAALGDGQRASFHASVPREAVDSSDLLRRHRNRSRLDSVTEHASSFVTQALRAAQSSLFLDIALSGIR